MRGDVVQVRRDIYKGETYAIKIGHRFGSVLMNIDGATVSMTVPVAFDLGWNIVWKAGRLTPAEHVAVRINGRVLELPKEQSLQVGGALLRKCDDADDFQLGKRIQA